MKSKLEFLMMSCYFDFFNEFHRFKFFSSFIFVSPPSLLESKEVPLLPNHFDQRDVDYFFRYILCFCCCAGGKTPDVGSRTYTEIMREQQLRGEESDVCVNFCFFRFFNISKTVSSNLFLSN